MRISFFYHRYIDLPQFLAICRTLFPYISTSEASSLFRESYNILFPKHMHHKPGPPGITFNSFMQAAECKQFFSKSMMLPMFLGSEQQNNLTEDSAQKLKSLIHMHSQQILETVQDVKSSLGERSRWRIDLLVKEIDAGLFDDFATTAGIRGDGAKVMRPLSAYRRLLA